MSTDKDKPSNKGHNKGNISYERERDPNLKTRKETGLSKNRVVILFGYVGTGYHGLQWDANFPTIEKELENAIYKIGGILDSNYGKLSRVGWARSSRTDKGVHALGNTVCLSMELDANRFKDDPLGLKISDEINTHLPQNIRTFSVIKTTRRWSPRIQCSVRSYNVIWPKKYLNGKSVEEIREVLKHYVGSHNFHNFTRAKESYQLPKSNPNPNPNPNQDSESKDVAKQESEAKEIVKQEGEVSKQEGEPKPQQVQQERPKAGGKQDKWKKKGKGKKGEEDDDFEEEPEEEVEEEEEGEEDGDKPRGVRPPISREDQLAYYVPNPTHTRKILQCTVEPSFTLEDNGDWVTFKFIGESFAYNQIRRMLGFALFVAHDKIPLSALGIALKSPFKFHVPMIPGECLYLEGGTFINRQRFFDDLFQLLPKDSPLHTTHCSKSPVVPWTQLFEESHASTAVGAGVLQRMKEFRDKVLHPHIGELFKANDNYGKFIEELSHDRFKVPDLEVVEDMYTKWAIEDSQKREAKKIKRIETEMRRDRDQEAKRAKLEHNEPTSKQANDANNTTSTTTTTTTITNDTTMVETTTTQTTNN